ncbi:uncharacterized protein LOC100384556 [Zea mays]|uniref:Transposase MuDR plant domain-containing protein n=1 Tax=Zea mays TaxID=4577 RepID=C4IYJ4_MAIZE|nr:uncharacterized protein LOC100384556 [Zea mays]ACR33994.1 unknown [Zea mays]|eukprot:NP_001170540.1 uncharacterized protein LOC100384556 [Zea mays]
MDGDKSFGTIDEENRRFELALVPPPIPSTNSYPRVEPSIPFIEQPPPLVDWDSIAIQEEREDEGHIELCDEAQVYELLGFRHEDEMEEEINMQNDAVPNSSADGESGYGIPPIQGDEGALIPVVDNIPEMSMTEHDMNNPSMEVGTRYPNMKDFRLAVRQYAINKEFELGIEATNKSKYRGYCKGDGCPWSIVGFKKEGEVSVVVTVLNDVHTCTSSSRRRTTTPSCKWVASKAVSILRILLRDIRVTAVDTCGQQLGHTTNMFMRATWL